jgi:hypothetical protein
MSELRYTDTGPSRAVLAKVPNWVHAYGEEGRSGQDETTIKPQRQQDRIDDQTQYTTADIWFPTGSITLGVLFLASGRVTAVEVHESEAVWSVQYNGKNKVWWIADYRNPTKVTLTDPNRFPLKYCSRLAYKNKLPIKGVLNPDGSWSEWIIEEP